MSINDLSDEEIVQRLVELKKNGDSFSQVEKQYSEVIYRRYYQHGYNFCRYYGLSHNDAEDVLQDSFIRVFYYINTFQKGKPFKPWFLRIIFNKVKEKYKELKKVKFNDDDFMEKIPEPEEKNILEKFQNREYLNSIIEKAPEKLKRVLILHVFNDLDFEEIGKMLGITSRQARYRLEHAYEFIKAQIGAEDE